MGNDGLESRITELVLKALPQTVAIYGHGSHFENDNIRRDSDIDIALLLPPGESTPVSTLAQLSGDLEAALGRGVDISTLDRTTNVVFCKEVVVHGTPIFVADPRAMVGFRNIAIHQYQDLKLEVLQALIAGGIDDLTDFCHALGLEIE